MPFHSIRGKILHPKAKNFALQIKEKNILSQLLIFSIIGAR
jgi:hypothetical protein